MLGGIIKAAFGSAIGSGIGSAASGYFNRAAKSRAERDARNRWAYDHYASKKAQDRSQDFTRSYNSAEAEKARKFTREMDNTKLQRMMADAKKAGINPYYLFPGGASPAPNAAAASGSSSPSSGARYSESPTDVSNSTIGNLSSAVLNAYQTRNLRAQTRMNQSLADSARYKSEIDKERARRKRDIVDQETTGDWKREALKGGKNLVDFFFSKPPKSNYMNYKKSDYKPVPQHHKKTKKQLKEQKNEHQSKKHQRYRFGRPVFSSN